MAALETKQKILDASLLLFNESGISNVRLQQIADESGISVGNLAYHFNNKGAITESLITTVIISLQDLLRQYGKNASLDNLDFFFKKFFRLCTRYRFFNFDILEIKRNFPASYELLQPLLNRVKLQLERRFVLCVQQHLLQKGTNIKNIASNTWLLMFYGQADGQLNGKNILSENAFRRRLWDFMKVYFTEEGIAEFNSSIEPELTGR